jgi:hypothetical protein
MNSIIKTAAKTAEELSQPNEKSDAKQEGIQHTKARLGEVLTFKNRASYSRTGVPLSSRCCILYIFFSKYKY